MEIIEAHTWKYLCSFMLFSCERASAIFMEPAQQGKLSTKEQNNVENLFPPVGQQGIHSVDAAA